MLVLKPPGVYAPQEDTCLLLDALRTASIRPGARVLDVCTGSGVVALTAWRLGAGDVSAVDVSWRAVLAARGNALLHRARVRVRHGDFTQYLGQGRFDLVTANPPYVPSPQDAGKSPRRARAWDAGPDGRDVVDRLCAAAPRLLAPGGMLLMVHSSLSGTGWTVEALRRVGLKVSVVARRRQPFGPVMRGRAAWFEERGLITPGQREEELVVIRADLIQPGT